MINVKTLSKILLISFICAILVNLLVFGIKGLSCMGGGRMNSIKISLELANGKSYELDFSKKYNIKIVETGEDYRTEKCYFNVEIDSADSYFIRLRRVHCNSKQDPFPKVAISKIVEVNEVEE